MQRILVIVLNLLELITLKCRLAVKRIPEPQAIVVPSVDLMNLLN